MNDYDDYDDNDNMMMTKTRMTIRAVRMPKAGLSDTLLIGISATSHALTCMSS